jgi:hypothetical protein
MAANAQKERRLCDVARRLSARLHARVIVGARTASGTQRPEMCSTTSVLMRSRTGGKQQAGRMRDLDVDREG